jgi:hypothetical protein
MLSQSRNSRPFTEAQGSSLCSKQPASHPCPKPDESNLHSPTIIPSDTLQYYPLLYTHKFSELSLYQSFQPKVFTYSIVVHFVQLQHRGAVYKFLNVNTETLRTVSQIGRHPSTPLFFMTSWPRYMNAVTVALLKVTPLQTSHLF